MEIDYIESVFYIICLLMIGAFIGNYFATNSLKGDAIDYFETRIDSINNISDYYNVFEHKFWINENTTFKYFIDNYYLYKPYTEHLLKQELNRMCRYHYD